MARAIASRRNSEREPGLNWSGRVTLTRRILAVNIFALAMLAGGFFYLDSYRSRIVDSRTVQAVREARLAAAALAAVPAGERASLMLTLARETGNRIRLFEGGSEIADTSAMGLDNFTLDDPARERWGQTIGRWLDTLIDAVVRAAAAPLYAEPPRGIAPPDVAEALERGVASARVWRAPDRTPIITAAAPLAGGMAVMTAVNARDITETVRLERFRLSIVLLVTTLVSIYLSLFLARTIVGPLRRLARAAVRVRLGRAREVVVPRLPERRDEIGSLARALSDMSQALRARIDATEAFAADVTHEMKNPLASLRSAAEGLDRVQDPDLRGRLMEIIRDDIRRLDRLITDISEASRLDAQLSRAKFEPVDVAAMIEALIAQRAARGIERGVAIQFEVARDGALVVMGEAIRLERVFENLIDNAISFSPDGGTVRLTLGDTGPDALITVDDEGPGVPEEAREKIFRRFQSIRPEGEAFGQHSGLGLAIARAIVDGHQGTITVESRDDRISGARFVVTLPLAA
ncbi:ATP-binding protein [Sphingomonas sp.]|uniref:sensor histidine kinase n=1 Tax=Sphingomonas sp. TaxID=28214 RepID=UPI001E044ED2|nr:ATP-binding protein [Sphingomonas sp.]MBX9796078.1 sensor N-terminal transmembrane domain-containing protein [Sphingomonas sp.]